MLEIISFLILSLALGFKHSYDSDHIVAVSNTLRKARSFKSSVRMGFSWAAGHVAAAATITVLLYIFKESLMKSMLAHLEKVAGIMIIILGILSLKDFFRLHFHRHRHGKLTHLHLHFHAKKEPSRHEHKHIFGIGIIQGLASNDELLVLLTVSLGAGSLGLILLGIGFFSVGVVLGMMLFSFVLTYPLIKLHSKKIYNIFSLATGFAGIAYGALIVLA